VPRREGPLLVPLVEPPRAAPPRRVLVSGPLDAAAATRVAAELMELDGRGAGDVELLVNSDGGPLADVLPLLDVIGLMRAPVHTRCVGRAVGTAAVLLACGTGDRRAARHALISLRCTDRVELDGSPAALRAQVEELERIRHHVVAALASRTGRPEAALADQLDHGELLDATAAAELGLIDAVG
jgi:ATP-dependent Clp protease protease subunit